MKQLIMPIFIPSGHHHGGPMSIEEAHALIGAAILFNIFTIVSLIYQTIKFYKGTRIYGGFSLLDAISSAFSIDVPFLVFFFNLITAIIDIVAVVGFLGYLIGKLF